VASWYAPRHDSLESLLIPHLCTVRAEKHGEIEEGQEKEEGRLGRRRGRRARCRRRQRYRNAVEGTC
jgi:hypothetical protein